MLSIPVCFRNSTFTVAPNYFIEKLILSKNLIHYNFNIMRNMPVQMQVDRCVITHDTLDGHEVFVHPVEVILLVPDVTIHLFLKGSQFIQFHRLFSLFDFLRQQRVPAQVDFLGVISAGGKGGIDIDQIHSNSLIFQIGAGGKTFAADKQILSVEC